MYHTIPLNVVKNQIVRALDLEMLDKAKVDKQIENFPWTGEFKDGRLPDNLKNIAKVLHNGTLKATRSSLFQWQNVSWKVKLPVPWNMKLYALCLG